MVYLPAFLVCDPPLRIRIAVFKCLVYAPAVSAWTAVSPAKAHTDALDSIMLHFGRKLLAERACNKKELTPPLTQSSEAGSALPVEPACTARRLCNASVWRLLSHVSVDVEL